MSNQSPEHHVRRRYPALTDALADAERVALDLYDVVTQSETLILDRDQLEFLVRRNRGLISAAYRKALEAL